MAFRVSPALNFSLQCLQEQVWTGLTSREGRGPGRPGHEGGQGGGGEVEAGTEGPGQQRLGDTEGPRHEGGRGEPQPLQLRLLQPLGLGSPVLEPDLDLGLRQLQLGGELCPLGYRQVLLLPELLLQGVQLLGGEGGAGLPVGLVLPQGTAQGAGRGLEPEVCNSQALKYSSNTQGFL